jgi:hypothetical protein
MTKDDLAVTYTLSAFKRAKFVGGGKHLLLKSDQDLDVALEALREVANVVTEDLYEYETRDEAYVSLGPTVPTPHGVMLWVRDCEPAKALPLMLDRVAVELAARGIVGTLVPAKTYNDTPFGSQPFPVLGMLLSPLNDTDAMYAAFEDWDANPPHGGLWVDEDRHQRVIELLMDWLTRIEGTVLIHSAGNVEVDPSSLVPYVTRTLESEPTFAVSATSPDRRWRRQITFYQSEILVYDYEPDQPRRDQLDSLVELSVQLAPDLAYALVREIWTSTMNPTELGHVPPRIQLFENVHFTTMLKHLEADYVFDAGVAQVLTSSQLAKTGLSPERWSVRDLEAERYLVTYNDPDVWLHSDPHYVHTDRGTLPPDWSHPDAFAAARADFGPAIMSLETLRQHPPPMTAEQISADPTLRDLGVTPP